MPVASTRWLRFKLERWIQRGVLHQLLLMAGLILAVSVVGGLIAGLFSSKFDGVGPAIWWAFLRLTDPGYLGDDEGLLLRTVSTVVTVLGYVLFMGSLIAIMTQWLARTIRRLESGLTPISMQDHVVILGWTNRTPEIVLRLLTARGRLDRFLDRTSVSRLRIVILAQEVNVELQMSLREYLGSHWRPDQVFLRSGSSLHREHVERLDLARAAVVVVPGSDFELGGTELTDTRIVKSLITLNSILVSSSGEHTAHVVAEIFDPHKVAIAQSTMAHGLDIVASDRVVSRLITQSVRHPGMSRVLLQILSHREGNSFYVRAHPELAGTAPQQLCEVFPDAIVVGIVRRDGASSWATLNPAATDRLGRDDLLVMLARSYDGCALSALGPPVVANIATSEVIAPDREVTVTRLLILGWSLKIQALLGELGSCVSERFEVTIMSKVAIGDRQPVLRRVDFDPKQVVVRHIEGDYALPTDLEQIDIAAFDHLLFLASGWMGSSEGADARTILGFVLLRSLLSKCQRDPPQVLVELLDPDNSRLFSEAAETLLISPRILSHILAHVSLRPELNAVFEALFRSGGSEIVPRRVADYDLVGETVSFAALQKRAAERDEVALGLLIGGTANSTPELNPSRDQLWELAATDRIIVLAGRDDPGDDGAAATIGQG